MKPPVCRKIIVTQAEDNIALSGPHQLSFNIDSHLSASIFQCGNRTIEISSVDLVPCDKLFSEFQSIEKLLMLLDGRFYPIETLPFSQGNPSTEEEMEQYSAFLLENRLGYYSSKDFCKYPFTKILDFPVVLNTEMYQKWKKLLEQMDISYQMFLYALSDNKVPVDVNFAFLVELAEPFVKLAQENTSLCKTHAPGEQSITLRKCLDTIIKHFGADIFSKELNGSYKDFLDSIKGNRVRIMHIKQNQSKYFGAKECVRYSMKFSLLYRRILLELLGVPYASYKTALKTATKSIDSW